MREFSVGNFYVDIARSKITDQGEAVAVEPRVLQVLLVLAEKQGEVVSHEDILTTVWPDVYVAPNALQRCIAQLRKAFKDDAKQQRIIVTHPKRGYSLVAEVSWQEKAIEQTEKTAKNNEKMAVIASQTELPQNELTTVNTNVHNRFWSIFSIVLIACITSFYYWEGQFNHLTIKQLTPLTTTDNQEYSPRYSPDGRYIAFERHINTCENQIWAKDTQTKEEFLLTQVPGYYGPPSWSPDGSKLVFSLENNCGVEQKIDWCSDIHLLSFTLAKNSPQLTNAILPCGKNYIYQAVWLSDDKIAWAIAENQHYKVMSLTLSDNKLSTLYSTEDNVITTLDYSAQYNKLAVMQYDAKRMANLVLLDPDNNEFSQVTLRPPEKYKYNTWWPVSWHPKKELLLSSQQNSLFFIDLHGEFSEISIPSMHQFNGANYHPEADKIIANMIFQDLDLVELQLPKLIESDGDKTQYAALVGKGNVLHRSTVSEFSAQYQPQGSGIAFISQRSGSKQIWLTRDGANKAEQLSYFDGNVRNNFRWSATGDALLVVADRRLYLLNLAGEKQQLVTPFDIVDIYQVTDKNHLLLSVVEQGNIKVVLFNMTTANFKVLYQGDIYLAKITKEQVLYVIDNQDKFKKITAGNEEYITELADLNIISMFYRHDLGLLLEDSDSNLWRYDLVEKTRKILLPELKDVDQITDIDLDNRRLLFDRLTSSSREVVLLE